MDLTLSITSDSIDDHKIQELTRDMCKDLNLGSTEITARLAEDSGGVEQKGDPVTIGTIILSLIGSGGVAVTLINLAKVYIERGAKLKIRIQKANGDDISIEETNLSSTQIDRTTELVKKILEEAK